MTSDMSSHIGQQKTGLGGGGRLGVSRPDGEDGGGLWARAGLYDGSGRQDALVPKAARAGTNGGEQAREGARHWAVLPTCLLRCRPSLHPPWALNPPLFSPKRMP